MISVCAGEFKTEVTQKSDYPKCSYLLSFRKEVSPFQIPWWDLRLCTFYISGEDGKLTVANDTVLL